ncbi:MAG: UTP--glucose-1-phosphate uridylyltransferase, partial [Ignavibacteriales bacterium]|nr:UTP--glucose-1-phosphate uridylyltransferase [Ignavibacteriales bacterium]
QAFDFAADYLGLLRAGLIAAGVIPAGMEGTSAPLERLLERLVGPGAGLELTTRVNGIPKGSRLAVSTSLLASVVAVCMRATGQTRSLTGALEEKERRVVAARAILGEWLGGSGGGWQDSGGVWRGVKLISGAKAEPGDPEYGVSRGRLLPNHRVYERDEISEDTRRKLSDSLVLAHGGMAQDVGPVLEMVTEKYLLRLEKEWRAREEAGRVLDEIVEKLIAGDVRGVGAATNKNFFGPVQSIIPWASNLYTERIVERMEAAFGADFWGFWMLGGMAGGGMGFMFDPARKEEASRVLLETMREEKRTLERAAPFAMDPVVYDFRVNERGAVAELLEGSAAFMPREYYLLVAPALARAERGSLSRGQRGELERFGAACRSGEKFDGMLPEMFDRLFPRGSEEEGVEESLDGMLDRYGFDAVQHERIRSDMRAGRIGLAQNRLPVSAKIEDARPEDVFDATGEIDERYAKRGARAIADGEVAVVTLAAGAGSRWTQGAGVVKAINAYAKFEGKYRTFVETHLAKSRKRNREFGVALPHVFTTGFMTHDAIEDYLKRAENYGYEGATILSPGRNIGLRFVPTARDLRFAWEETPQQLLDERKQQALEGLHNALLAWARQTGEASDYTDNLPRQCVHPTGHWYEVPNMLLNGALKRLLDDNPSLQYLLVHNIDTLGADVDPALLGWFAESGATTATEVIHRRIEDRGGGLARVNGETRLVEGMALPREEIEFGLSYYNSATTWTAIDKLLAAFGITRAALGDRETIVEAVRALAARMPTYLTLKDVKKRWGKGQEDVFPTAQFEKLWGDMTALEEIDSRFVVVPRTRGQQLKEPAQLDGWLRDGSAERVNDLCEWT